MGAAPTLRWHEGGCGKAGAPTPLGDDEKLIVIQHDLVQISLNFSSDRLAWPPMTTATHLDLQAAADELGVHYQTAYRWVRSGRLPARRVAGKYVVDRTDLVELERSRTTPDDPPPPSALRLDRAAERLSTALLDGDDAAARRLVRRLADEGTPMAELIERVVAPPLRDIGERWHRGELPIWVEHRSTGIVERLLADIVPNPRGRRRGTAVVAALGGDLHSLPTAMATVVLRADQWHVHHLGADVPAAELIDCCRENDADLAVVSVTYPDLDAEISEVADRLRSIGTPVLIGGPGRRLDDLVADARTATAVGEPAT